MNAADPTRCAAAQRVAVLLLAFSMEPSQQRRGLGCPAALLSGGVLFLLTVERLAVARHLVQLAVDRPSARSGLAMPLGGGGGALLAAGHDVAGNSR
jgi:hypothetical protein